MRTLTRSAVFSTVPALSTLLVELSVATIADGATPSDASLAADASTKIFSSWVP